MPWCSPKVRPKKAYDSGLLEKARAYARRRAAEAPPNQSRRWLFNGRRPEPVPSYLGVVEPPEVGKLGVCCSGGGIRSAAFSLGALQALQEEKELRRAAYLAAVSGGSYIAAAISMVAKTGKGDSDETLLKRKGPFAPGSPEEQYLRNRCSYLAPTLTEKLYLGLRIVLGLLLNLAFVSMPLVGLALLLSGLLYAPLVPHLAGQCSAARCSADIPAWFWLAPLGALLLSTLCGLATLLFRWRKEKWERFFATWAARLLIAAVLLAVILVGLPYLVDWLDHLAEGGKSVEPQGNDAATSLGAGILALIAGVFAQLGYLLSSKDAIENVGRVRKAVSKLGSGARLVLVYAAGALFGPLLLLAIVALTVASGLGQATRDGGIDGSLVAAGGVVLAAFAVVYFFADLTTWSLHPFYRRRLSSAFALKRVSEVDLGLKERKRVEALKPAGGSDYAGIAVERNFDRLVPLSETALSKAEGERAWPTLLVCAAANVSDPGATPPGRRVTSFTFSAHTVGGPLVGAVEMSRLERAFESREEAKATEKFRDKPDEKVAAGTRVTLARMGVRKHRRRDLTLPAAVAMSGAAISPSMGKMTKRPLTFLMALANIRLGVWVPNPRWVASAEEGKTVSRVFTRPRPWYLLCELFGFNRVNAKYLYVSDGGHFENLGLVELLRRGCTEIYCFDASGVGKGRAEFEALGDAIALARSELGVEIEFGNNPEDLAPEGKKHESKRDVVKGTITYPKKKPNEEAATGTLIYARNTITHDAPWDAQAYHKADPRFPHNPTVDQLYTDQKFEAYRVLGARAGASAVAAMKA